MSWYHVPGKEQDVAVCTQVFFFRNLAGYPFSHRLDAGKAREILRAVGSVLEKNGFLATDFADVSRSAAQSLVEKRFISPYFTRESIPHALFLNDPCNLTVMVCEREHVSVQCILSGFSPEDAFEGASKAESLLDESLDLAFDERFGYLTADPSRLGCAMEASVILSLPLLTEAGRIGFLADAASRAGFTLTAALGHSYPARGSLYRLAGRIPLGITEEEGITALSRLAERIIGAERLARDDIAGERLAGLMDRVFRAEGVLRFAHSLPVAEMVDLFALLRVGAAMGMSKSIQVECLTALLTEAMPATLTLGVEPPPKLESERDILRAKTVRERLFGA